MKTSTLHFSLPDIMVQGENTCLMTMGPIVKGKHKISVFTMFAVNVPVKGWRESVAVHFEVSDGLNWKPVITFNKVFDCINAKTGSNSKLLFDVHGDIILNKTSLIRIRLERINRNKQTLAMVKAPSIELNLIKEN